MTIYLYVKTHRTTGLKYLGKTEQEPFKYQGSGDYWTNHINVHGYDVDTIILRECQSAEELKEWGLYYSNLWNVVESDEWANLKEESGDGFTSDYMKKLWTNDSHRELISSKSREQLKKQWEDSEFRDLIVSSKKNEMTTRWQDSDFREKKTTHSKKMWDDPEYRANQSEKGKKRWEDDERRKQQSELAASWWRNTENREKQSEISKARWKDEDFRRKTIASRSGEKHPLYDHTIYHFVNDDGREEHCTQQALRTKYSLTQSGISSVVKFARTHHKGWRLKTS